MSYREHAPPDALAPWLACTWERFSEESGSVRVLPDGCIDVVWTQGAGTQIVGANTTAFLVALPARTHVVGARLRPGAAAALLRVSAQALRDERVAVADVWGSDGARIAASLDEAADPVAGLRHALLVRARHAELPDPLVRAFVSCVERSDLAVPALAKGLHISERQLRRRVTCAVGYGPKRLARVLRLGRALQAARAGDHLARAAFEGGYADQAHFANECSRLAGVPPSILLAG